MKCLFCRADPAAPTASPPHEPIAPLRSSILQPTCTARQCGKRLSTGESVCSCGADYTNGWLCRMCEAFVLANLDECPLCDGDKPIPVEQDGKHDLAQQEDDQEQPREQEEKKDPQAAQELVHVPRPKSRQESRLFTYRGYVIRPDDILSRGEGNYLDCFVLSQVIYKGSPRNNFRERTIRAGDFAMRVQLFFFLLLYKQTYLNTP